MLTYFQILQVEENATQDEIKKSYRKLCKILHPDMHGNTPEANIIFRLLHESYETLSDPTKRRNYNPKNHSSTFDGVSYSDYDEMITSYKNIVADYEEIIKLKSQREKDLLNQINHLKKTPEKNDGYTDVRSTKVQSQNEESKTDKIIIGAIVIAIVITLFILFYFYPLIMTLFLVVGLFVGWVYKLFK